MTAPTCLTGEQFLAALNASGQVPPLFERVEAVRQPKGPRIVPTGLLPHKGEAGEVHAWVWQDGLCMVSRAVFDALKG